MSDQPQRIDLQINGYASVDFNQNDLSHVDLAQACEFLREDGVAGVLSIPPKGICVTRCRG
jgi:N-acetylglucosamine-6-phosphate deacetylase